MALIRSRVGGQGFTTFNWGSNLIAFADTITVTPPQPVAAPVEIQPLNAQRPLEIITPGAQRAGTIELVITEVYNKAIWQQMTELANSQDIVDIMRQLASQGTGITVTEIIHPGFQKDDSANYWEHFYNCIVSAVDPEGETISIETMEIQKHMTLMYTHSLKSYINSGSRLWPFNVDTGTVTN